MHRSWYRSISPPSPPRWSCCIFFRKDIPADYDLTKLKAPREAIRDLRTFKTGWVVLLLLLIGFCP